jgi:hypothetical protein
MMQEYQNKQIITQAPKPAPVQKPAGPVVKKGG